MTECCERCRRRRWWRWLLCFLACPEKNAEMAAIDDELKRSGK